MPAKKKRLARNIRLSPPATDYYSGTVGPSAHLCVGVTQSRQLTGAIGALIGRLAPEGGTLTMLNAPPKGAAWRYPNDIMVIGHPGGVQLVRAAGMRPEAEFVSMCSTYRDRLVGGVGKVRWARVKAVN